MHPDVVAQARGQLGLLTAEQLLDARLDEGDGWREVQPGVYASTFVDLTEDQQLEAVRLALDRREKATEVGWSLAGASAARILGLRVPDGGQPRVVVEGSSVPRLRGAHVLTSRDVPRSRRIRKLPVPCVAVTVVQCAAHLSRDDLVTLVEHAVRRKRCTLAELRAVCGRGVSGSRALRSVLDELERGGHDRWVRTLLPLLLAAGLPMPERERGLPDDVPIIFVDLCWWGLRLVIEVDDWQTHGSREAQERDRSRDRWLMSDYGAVVLRVTPRQIRDEPGTVVRDIVAAYRRAEKAAGVRDQ